MKRPTPGNDLSYQPIKLYYHHDIGIAMEFNEKGLDTRFLIRQHMQIVLSCFQEGVSPLRN